MLPSFARHTVELLTPVMVSDHGTLVADWSQQPTSTLSVPRCSFQPGTGAADTENRSGQQETAQLFLPPGTPIDPQQHIRFKGREYEIVGIPEEWDVTSSDHVLVRLDHWEG